MARKEQYIDKIVTFMRILRHMKPVIFGFSASTGAFDKEPVSTG
jgi:hypothetical protein